MIYVGGFEGWRVRRGYVHVVATPPREVSGATSPASLHNPYSFEHMLEHRHFPEELYIPVPGTCVYLYEYQSPEWKTLRGLIAHLIISPDHPPVVPHEETFPERWKQFVEIFRETRKVWYPLFLIAIGWSGETPPGFWNPLESSSSSSLLYEYKGGDDTRHRIAEIPYRAEHFRWMNREVQAWLLADGHHRWRALQEIAGEHNQPLRVPALIVPENYCGVGAYGRVLENPPQALLSQLLETFAHPNGFRESLRTLEDAHRIFQMWLEGKTWWIVGDRSAWMGKRDLSLHQVLEQLHTVWNHMEWQAVPPLWHRWKPIWERMFSSSSQLEPQILILPPRPALQEVWKRVQEGFFYPPKSTWFMPKCDMGIFIGNLT